jgi:hypothetical protein
MDLGEFSSSLLLVRLEETAVGGSLRHDRRPHRSPVAHSSGLAHRDHVQAIGHLVDHATDCLLGDDLDTECTLRADARDIDVT